MIIHISRDNHESYPATALCGKVKKRRGLFGWFYCKKCTEKTIELANELVLPSSKKV